MGRKASGGTRPSALLWEHLQGRRAGRLEQDKGCESRGASRQPCSDQVGCAGEWALGSPPFPTSPLLKSQSPLHL